MRTTTSSVTTILGLALMLAPVPLLASDDWDLLGTRRVSLAAEHDVIDLRNADGQFNAIRIDVDAGTVEMFNIRVVFANGEDFSPDTRVVFREGEHSRIIDLPGVDRTIRQISFNYKSQRRTGQAVVRVFGRRVNRENGPGVGTMRDWDRIGSREVDFKVDHDMIPAAFEGSFRSIMIGVTNGDLEIYNVKVNFANGESFSPDTRLSFQNDTHTRVIDLPGNARVIRSIQFTYRSLRNTREGKATVSVYGRK